ncbi:MAG: hypothetical protein ACR2FX_12540 [Chthoniobacterales bacterium]
MALKFNEDFRYPFRDGAGFSGGSSGFLAVESLELAKKEDTSHLQLSRHVDFICEILQKNGPRCFWLVESPSDRARKDLISLFPEHDLLNGSLSGYLEFDPELISQFWAVFDSVDRVEPWKNEQAWALGNVAEKLPTPRSDSIVRRPYWSVEHVLKNCEKVNTLFVQAGWFAFFAVRPFDGVRAVIERQFPELKAQDTRTPS